MTIVPGGIDATSVAYRDPREPDLPPGLSLRTGSAVATTRHWYDTFDRRLLGAGVELYREAAGRRARIVVERCGVQAVAGDWGPGGRSTPPALTGDDLPVGIRETLGALPGGRALVALARARVTRREDAVVDADEKTVCRLIVTTAEVHPDGSAETGPAAGVEDPVRSTTVAPLRGYEEECRRVAATVGATSGLLVTAVLERTGGTEAPGGGSAGRDLRPSRPAPEAIASIVRHLLETVQANVPGTLARFDDEFLHDLRVAVRRGRTALKLARDVVAEEPRSWLADELKWLGDVTTPARDMDVHVADFPVLEATVSEDLRPATEPFQDLLVARREAAHRGLGAALRSGRFARLMDEADDRLDRLADPAAAPGLTTAALARRRLEETFGRVVRRGRRIGPDSPDEAVHDLRKRAKELRYTIEFFSGLLPGDGAAPLVRDLKGLQDVLGRFNDTVVQREVVREAAVALATSHASADTLLALGEMSGELARAGRKARAQLAPTITALDRWRRDGRWDGLLAGLG